MPEETPLRNKNTVGTWGKEPYKVFNPKYRKRRKSEGIDDQLAALAPSTDELEEAKRHGRVYCKQCGHFKPWKDLKAHYERRGTDWFVMWFCKKCNNMVTERNLDDRP
jgi:hypothetical protein